MAKACVTRVPRRPVACGKARWPRATPGPLSATLGWKPGIAAGKGIY